MFWYCFIGFLTISLIGASLHFVYDLLKHNKCVSFLVAVNESTWEHLKLAFLPTFIWILVGSFLHINNFAFGAFIAILTIAMLIPVIFYTYTHFTKRPILAIDISSFFVGIGLGMFFAYLIFNSKTITSSLNIVGIVGIVLFVIAFVLFTYLPPHIFLFVDPITKKYGRSGHLDDATFGNRYKYHKNQK